MHDQDRRRIIEEHNARLRAMAERDYRDYRAVDTAEPDCRPAIEQMVERHPDPTRGKKALLYDLDLHEDSWRKYLSNKYGPPFGLVERLMQRTGCYKPLYRLAARCGFILVPRRDITWDRRRKLTDIAEIQQAFLDLQNLYLALEPGDGKKPRSRSDDQRRKILNLARSLQEQLEGLHHSVDRIDPQFSLFND